MTMIQVHNLSKHFKKNGAPALDNVSLTVRPGEMVALIGASGSGKSTLLRHIAGLAVGNRDRDCCRITVKGEAVQHGGRLSKTVRRTRSHIGVVFQQFNLVDRMTVLSNVLVGRLGKVNVARGSLGLFTREEKRAAMRALDRVGMASFATQRASTLSGGQQQRVAIARTLIQESEVVLADEPIASLDPESSRKVMEALSSIHQDDGKTVLVSLHQVDYAFKYCPRTVALKDGKIHYDGPSADLSLEFLRDLYGSDSLELMLPDNDEASEPQMSRADGKVVGFGRTDSDIAHLNTAFGTA